MSGGVVDALRLKISSDSIGSLRADRLGPVPRLPARHQFAPKLVARRTFQALNQGRDTHVPWELHQDVNVVGSSAERVNSRPKLGSFVLHGPMQGLVQSLINGSPSPTR